MDTWLSIIGGGATIVLAMLTAWYVRLTYHILQEARAAKEPNVWVDLELTNYSVKLVVGNTGASPARNIKLSVQDNIYWRSYAETKTSLADLVIVKDGISYLAPGRALKFEAGLIDRDKTLTEKDSFAEIRLTYETDSGKEISRVSRIDMNQYREVLLESFREPESDIAEAIRNTESGKQSRKFMDSAITRMTMKQCPVCGERINRSAKKCPRCLEFISANGNP